MLNQTTIMWWRKLCTFGSMAINKQSIPMLGPVCWPQVNFSQSNITRVLLMFLCICPLFCDGNVNLTYWVESDELECKAEFKFHARQVNADKIGLCGKLYHINSTTVFYHNILMTWRRSWCPDVIVNWGPVFSHKEEQYYPSGLVIFCPSTNIFRADVVLLLL